MHISASLLGADFACLDRDVRRAQEAGVDSFHFDWMDGHYVPNIALSPGHLVALRPRTHLPFHVHLELANPDEVLQNFPPWSADAIIVCWNTLADPLHTFKWIRSRTPRVGLSLNPDDPLDAARDVLAKLDLLVILGVHPGFGGQAIQANTLSRLRDARQCIDQMTLPLSLAVDGGVTLENAPFLLEAGADTLITGTSLFQSSDASRFVRRLRESG
jgi:ribulose-phosphate 3-epimerase